VIEEKAGGAGLVETGVGLPPQLTDKRKVRAIEARHISFHFFFVIAKTRGPVTAPFSV
jgi:hypothetical protein